ncbi:hypothetical protein D3C71_1186820 [compost metagenome]
MRTSFITTTKNTGTNTTASVAVIIPPITPVPMACWLAELAPVAIASGTTPRMNAREVMTIGRNRRRAACRVASIRSWPSSYRLLANSMIRIAFFADRPMMVISPTLKNTSLGIPRKVTASTAPSTPSGTTSSTEVGIDQLSYNAARHRNTINSDSPSRIGAWLPDNRSCNDNPVHSWPRPAGPCATSRSISAMASPVLWPGVGSPEMLIAG